MCRTIRNCFTTGGKTVFLFKKPSFHTLFAVSVGATEMEFIIIRRGLHGNVQVTDWGISAGIAAGGNIGAVGGEINMMSGTISVNSGVTMGGVVPNALGIK